MSMSDCEKCWETPCCCGWEYRSWSKERREDLAASALGVNLQELREAIQAPEKHPKLKDETWSNSQTAAGQTLDCDCRSKTRDDDRKCDHDGMWCDTRCREGNCFRNCSTAETYADLRREFLGQNVDVEARQ